MHDKDKHKHKHKDKHHKHKREYEEEEEEDFENDEGNEYITDDVEEYENNENNDVTKDIYVSDKVHKLDKGTVCQLINASIEEEAIAGHDYADILEVIPTGEEYEECAEAITEIMEDEINHALVLIKMGKKLGCKKPRLNKEDEEILKVVGHIHKIEIE